MPQTITRPLHSATRPPTKENILAQYSNSGYIRGLDGLRAISVLLVIIGHSGFERFPGSLGVTIFFFISGYLITSILQNEYTESGRLNVKNFYIRRFARLFPEQFVYILVSLIVTILSGSFFRAIDYISATTYTTNYLNILSPAEYKNLMPFGHFWSLAVEEHFYLIWPITLVTISFIPRKAIIVLATVIFMAAIFRFFGVFYFKFPHNYPGMASECRIDSIAFGCLLAVKEGDSQRRNFLKNYNGDFLLYIGIFVIAISTYFPPTFRVLYGSVDRLLVSDLHLVFVHTFQGIGLYLCFTALYVSIDSTFSRIIIRFLELEILRNIGRYSYGIYVWHFSVIYLFSEIYGVENLFSSSYENRILCAIFSIITSYLFGKFSFKFVLGPFWKIRKHFGSHKIPERY